MSKLHLLSHLHQTGIPHGKPNRLPSKQITKTYLAVIAGLFLVAGLATAMAAGSQTTGVQSKGTAQTEVLQPEAQPLEPNQPDPTQANEADPESSSGPTIESEGVTNQSGHSVSITSDNSGTTVNVDGQTSTVPANGSMDQSFSTGGSSPNNVHISIDNSSSQSAAGSSSNSRVSVRSSTRIEGRSSSTSQSTDSNQ